MKKTLLLIISSFLIIAAMAQKTGLIPQPRLHKIVATQSNMITDETAYPSNKINNYLANERDQDIVIGNTWYDLQSNSSMAQRIYAFEDGVIGATWTRGVQSPPSYPDRGTGYNYFDGNTWGPSPTDRIENLRTGWPSYAPYGENGEIICSHDFGAGDLIFSWRENKGTGEWNFFTLDGPEGYDFMAWPRMTTSGENRDVIHVIANLPTLQNGDVPYEGLNGATVYSRSDDGGQTWDPKNVILDGMGSDYAASWGADDYAWAEPNAGVIAFVTFGGIADGIIMKSEDDGDSWERITFYASPDPFFDGNGGDLPVCGGGDGCNAIAIDDEGVVHVAFGRQIHLDDTPDDDAWSYYPYSDGLIYWNETMPALDTAQIKAEILPDDWSDFPIYQNGQLAAWTQPNGEDTIVGVATYYASLTSMPQIVIHDGIVQIFTSSLAVGFDNEEYNFRHIWGTFTEGDGIWSEFTDYTNDVFHIFSECVYPSVAPSANNGMYHILYMTDNLPGNSTQPDPPTHDPVNNNMVYLPLNFQVGIENQITSSTFEVSQNFPNPVNGQTYFTVSLNIGADLKLKVTSLTGQVVSNSNLGYKSAGTHTLNMNTNDFVPGVYFYTVSTGVHKATRKMIVQ